MPNQNTCPRCGTELSDETVRQNFMGLCPNCLVDFAGGPAELTGPAGPGETGTSPATTEPDEEIFPEGAVVGQYKIIGLIGRGGMGVVYKAVHERLNRICALKVLPARLAQDKEFKNRFEREARIIAGLVHPNIIPIYEIGKVDGRDFIAMPFIEGELLDACPLVDLRQVLTIIKEAAEAVHYANLQGIVHRDLKPANIIIKKNSGKTTEKCNDVAAHETSRVYVTDFGIARLTHHQDKRLSVSGMMIGTPAYMSPEQARGELSIDARSDVYSLGVTLYELLTKRLPFPGNSPLDIGLKVIHQEPKSPRKIDPAIPREVEIIILKAMEKEPARRYPSVLALAEDIKRFLTGEPIQARPATVTYRLRKKIRKNPALFIALAAVVLAISIGTFITVIQISQKTSLQQQAQKEKSMLLDEKIGVETRMRQALAKINTLEQNLNTLQQNLGQEMNEKNKVLAQIKQANNQIGNLSAELKQLQSQRQQLEQNLAGLQKSLAEETGQRTAVQEQLNQSVQKATLLEKEITEHKNKNTALENEVKNIQASLQKETDRTGTLQQKLTAAENQINTIGNERTQLSETISGLNHKLSQMQTTLKQTEQEQALWQQVNLRLIEEYGRLLQTDPNYAAGYLHRGYACYFLKRYAEAAADWQKAIELNPSFKTELDPFLEQIRKTQPE